MWKTEARLIGEDYFMSVPDILLTKNYPFIRLVQSPNGARQA
jgi:hypothetical protein